jgi:hypothetical protein
LDVRVLGVEYEDKEYTGKREGMMRGVQPIFNQRDHSFSSSGLRSRVVEAETLKILKKDGFFKEAWHSPESFKKQFKRKKIWRKINSEKLASKNLKANYGITLDQKKQIVQSQNNLCAICKILFENPRTTHLDHDHTTGKIRGILCQKCNHGIGLFKDSTELLKSAILYLDKHAKKEIQ